MSTNGVMLGRNRRGYLVPFLGLLSFTSDSFVPPPQLSLLLYRIVLPHQAPVKCSLSSPLMFFHCDISDYSVNTYLVNLFAL